MSPIRTNRGRVAVYRKLWGWPMRSPRHLLATSLVFLAVVLTVGLIVPRLAGSPGSSGGGAATFDDGPSSTSARPGASAPAAQPTSPTSSSLPTRLTTSAPTTVNTPLPPAAINAANSWARAWVDHPDGTTPEKWLEGMRPFTTEEYFGAVLSKVDMASVAATEVTGQPVPGTNYGSSVVVRVPTNAGVLGLTLISTPSQGWRVTLHEPAA